MYQIRQVCLLYFLNCSRNTLVSHTFRSGSTESSPPRKKTNTEKQKEMKDEKLGWKEIEAERLPLQYQNPGVIAWAKIAGHSWWPGTFNAFFLFFLYLYFFSVDKNVSISVAFK